MRDDTKQYREDKALIDLVMTTRSIRAFDLRESKLSFVSMVRIIEATIRNPYLFFFLALSVARCRFLSLGLSAFQRFA